MANNTNLKIRIIDKTDERQCKKLMKKYENENYDLEQKIIIGSSLFLYFRQRCVNNNE